MYTDKITFNLATMPSRVASLKDIVHCILPQCDKINVYLNDFPEVPEFLYHPKIEYFKSQDHAGDLGDAGKFFKVASLQGYIFTADDDLLYPPDYAAVMIKHIERFNRKAVITCHGRIFHSGRPVASLYRDFAQGFACTKHCPESFINLPGTGVTAFHSDTCLPTMDIFKASNMADVWLALFCQKNAIPVFCISHANGWIRESKSYDRDYTIWRFCHEDDSYQTAQLNTITNWKLYTHEDSLCDPGL